MAVDTTLPFLVFEGRDLSIYETLDSIERDLEGIDVDDGAYEAFDSIGRVVRLKASGVRRGRFTVDIGQTHAEVIESAPIGANRLYDLIRSHLRCIGRNIPKNLSLPELVAKCVSANDIGRTD